MTTIVTSRDSWICGVQVTDTCYVVPPDSAPYYRIEVAAPSDVGATPLLTRDRAIYQQAEAAYATGEIVDCEWVSKSLDGKPVRALVAIRRGV